MAYIGNLNEMVTFCLVMKFKILKHELKYAWQISC